MAVAASHKPQGMQWSGLICLTKPNAPIKTQSFRYARAASFLKEASSGLVRSHLMAAAYACRGAPCPSAVHILMALHSRY